MMHRQPLNLFQRLVRSWEAIHPYNAAQVLQLHGEPPAGAVNEGWHRALESLGLGKVRVNGRTYGYYILNGEARKYPVQWLAPGTCLARHLSCALNAPFVDPGEPPFRPFVIPGPGSFHLGMAYRHWVADSVSIRMLLREWCATFCPGVPQGEVKPRHSTGGYWNLYGPRRSPWPLEQSALGALRGYLKCRSVQKVLISGVADRPVRVLLRHLPRGLIDRLRIAVRGQGATVGDALLAAVAMASHRHLPLQRRPQRRDLAVGNIIDLRPHAGRDISHDFGMHLGFAHVICRRQSLEDFPALLRSIMRQNQSVRRAGVAQTSLTWMLAGHIAQEYGKPPDLYRFYRKELPLAAGVSNVNLHGSWAQKLHPLPVLDYIRASPTGPLAPLVVSTTTLGRRMSLALTYRPAMLSETEASDLAQTIIDVLTEAATDTGRD